MVTSPPRGESYFIENSVFLQSTTAVHSPRLDQVHSRNTCAPVENTDFFILWESLWCQQRWVDGPASGSREEEENEEMNNEKENIKERE